MSRSRAVVDGGFQRTGPNLEADAAMTLDQLEAGRPAVVLDVSCPPGHAEWRQQLADIGFVPGEPVQVLRRAAIGGDPMVVRIGASTFALRRAEAACVGIRARA